MVTARPLGEPNLVRYEASFRLASDPLLDAAGVVVSARVDGCDHFFEGAPRAKNRVVFSLSGDRGGRRLEAEVQCVHTAVCLITTDELAKAPAAELVEMAVSSENEPIWLPAVEHFTALRSYVAGVAEVGVGCLLRAKFATGAPRDLAPLAFNDFMRRQVLHGLLELAERDWLVVQFVASHADVADPWDREFWLRLKGLAEKPNLSAAAAGALAAVPHWEVARALGANPSTPPSLLAKLAQVDPLGRLKRTGKGREARTPFGEAHELGTWKIRASVASNPSAPPGVLVALGSATDVACRRAVASNPATPPAALKQLTRDADDSVVERALANPVCPAEALEDAARSGSLGAKVSVAKNPNAPPRALRALAADPSVVVRLVVVRNPGATRQVLDALSRDQNRVVRKLALATRRVKILKPLPS